MPHPHAGLTRHPEVPTHPGSPFRRCSRYRLLPESTRLHAGGSQISPGGLPDPHAGSVALQPLRPAESPPGLPGPVHHPYLSRSPAAQLLPCRSRSVLGPGRAALGPRGAQLSPSSRKYQRADPGEAERGSGGRRREEGAADAKPRADGGRIGCWGDALGIQSLPGACSSSPVRAENIRILKYRQVDGTCAPGLGTPPHK